MTTRRVHVVRVTDPQTKMWVNVKVLDAIAYVGPDGAEILLECDASKANPYILDETGDGNGKGSASSCSRASHMKRLTNAGYFFDVEILDGIAFKAPNGVEILALLTPKVDTAAVIDTTGNGLAVAASDSSTRTQHVVQIPPIPAGSLPLCLCVMVPDATSFRGPNGAENLLYSQGFDELDVTKYNSDGSPPENTDPNVYVKWPSGSAGPWLGKGQPVYQGPLWWIVDAKGTSGTYYVELWIFGTNTVPGQGITSSLTITHAGMAESDLPGNPQIARIINSTEDYETASQPELANWYIWDSSAGSSVEAAVENGDRVYEIQVPIMGSGNPPFTDSVEANEVIQAQGFMTANPSLFAPQTIINTGNWKLGLYSTTPSPFQNNHNTMRYLIEVAIPTDGFSGEVPLWQLELDGAPVFEVSGYVFFVKNHDPIGTDSFWLVSPNADADCLWAIDGSTQSGTMDFYMDMRYYYESGTDHISGMPDKIIELWSDGYTLNPSGNFDSETLHAVGNLGYIVQAWRLPGVDIHGQPLYKSVSDTSEPVPFTVPAWGDNTNPIPNIAPPLINLSDDTAGTYFGPNGP